MSLVFNLNSSKILAIHICIFFFMDFLRITHVPQFITVHFELVLYWFIFTSCFMSQHHTTLWQNKSLILLSFVLLLSHVLLFQSINFNSQAIVYSFFSYLSEKVKGENIQYLFCIYSHIFHCFLILPYIWGSVCCQFPFFWWTSLTFLEMKVWWILFFFI